MALTVGRGRDKQPAQESRDNDLLDVHDNAALTDWERAVGCTPERADRWLRPINTARSSTRIGDNPTPIASVYEALNRLGTRLDRTPRRDGTVFDDTFRVDDRHAGCDRECWNQD